MSQDDLSNDRTAPTGAPSDPIRAKPAAAPPRRTNGGSLALALLLALLAFAGVIYLGWQQWQQRQNHAADSHAVAALQQQVSTLQGTLSSVSSESTLLRQRITDDNQVNSSLREELLGQGDRLRALEDAVGKLSEKTLSGHDAMLLDETESLLRMANERYTLFHDAQGAAAAYALASQTLATVSDNAFSSVRQSIDAEHEALQKSQPVNHDSQLVALQQLRDEVADLPLKPLDSPSQATEDSVWARISRALSSVISVRRDNGAPLAVADARFARELMALDLAQAQAAILAWDNDAATAALKRAEASLGVQFDNQATSVQQAQHVLTTLADQLKPTAPVQLGAALNELRNLRAVHALKPADGTPPTNTPTKVEPTGGVKP